VKYRYLILNTRRQIDLNCSSRNKQISTRNLFMPLPLGFWKTFSSIGLPHYPPSQKTMG
jgi:hypothetical protein